MPDFDESKFQEQLIGRRNELLELNRKMGSERDEHWERFGKRAVEFHEFLMNSYREAGSPYGNNQRGRERWWNEQSTKAIGEDCLR